MTKFHRKKRVVVSLGRERGLYVNRKYAGEGLRWSSLWVMNHGLTVS